MAIFYFFKNIFCTSVKEKLLTYFGQFRETAAYEVSHFRYYIIHVFKTLDQILKVPGIFVSLPKKTNNLYSYKIKKKQKPLTFLQAGCRRPLVVGWQEPDSPESRKRAAVFYRRSKNSTKYQKKTKLLKFLIIHLFGHYFSKM